MSKLAPKWKPSFVQSTLSVQKCFSTYTDFKRHFAIFKNGTVVFSSPNSQLEPEQYFELLNQASTPPDFLVTVMEGENYRVKFSGLVYGIVLKNHFLEYQNEISNAVENGALLPSEQILPLKNNSRTDEELCIGLYARAKLFMDLQEKSIVDYFVP